MLWQFSLEASSFSILGLLHWISKEEFQIQLYILFLIHFAALCLILFRLKDINYFEVDYSIMISYILRKFYFDTLAVSKSSFFENTQCKDFFDLETPNNCCEISLKYNSLKKAC